jgi:peptide/nickel transport system permease protein
VTAFIIRRLSQGLLVVFAMTLIVFLSVNVIGNPVDILISQNCTGACREQVMRGLGLDLPLWQQYWTFLAHVAHGDFGRSFALGVPALQLVIERMPATLELAFAAMALAVFLGVPLGLYAGTRPESALSKGILCASIFGFSLPPFWVALMLIMVFAVYLGWLPPTGRGDTVSVFGVKLSIFTWSGLSHIVLPAINLAIFKLALVIRLTCAGVREILLMDFVKFARAKGLTNRRIVFAHVLKNVLIPIVTVLGLETGNTIAFAVVTETIFAWPGMGKLIIDSIQVLDRPVMVAYLIVTVLLFTTINLVVDILYSIIDPRVRLQKAKA